MAKDGMERQKIGMNERKQKSRGLQLFYIYLYLIPIFLGLSDAK